MMIDFEDFLDSLEILKEKYKDLAGFRAGEFSISFFPGAKVVPLPYRAEPAKAAPPKDAATEKPSFDGLDLDVLFHSS